MELLDKFFDKLSVKRKGDFGDLFPALTTEVKNLIKKTGGQESDFQDLTDVIMMIEKNSSVRPSQRKSAYSDYIRLKNMWKEIHTEKPPPSFKPEGVMEETEKDEENVSKSEHLRVVAQSLYLDWEYCSLHDTAKPAKWKCLQCDDFLCNECAKAHRKGKKLRFHRLLHSTEREQEEQIRKEIYCIEHDAELTMFCEDDKKLICSKCSLTDHKDHKMKTLEEVAYAKRTEVGKVLGQVDRELVPESEIVRQRLIDADSKVDEMERSNTELVEKVLKTVVGKIHSNAKALRQDMKQNNVKIKADIHSKLQKLNEQSRHLVDVSREVRRSLEQNSLSKLVLEAESLKKNLKEQAESIDLDLNLDIEEKKNYADICKSLLQNII